MVPPLVDQQQLSQACPKDGHAEEGAAEYESQEKPVIPLQNTEHNMANIYNSVTFNVLPACLPNIAF